MDNKYVRTVGIYPNTLYRLDDLSAFKFVETGNDVAELTAFSKTLNKFVPLSWYNCPNGLVEQLEPHKIVPNFILESEVKIQ